MKNEKKETKNKEINKEISKISVTLLTFLQ